MKITKTQLKQIIKEELKRTLNEQGPGQMRYYEPAEVKQYLPQIYEKFADYVNTNKLIFAFRVGSGIHYYKIGNDGKFKETGEISRDTGGLPQNLKQIEADLGI